MEVQYPTIIGDPLLEIKLDWMDAIKVKEPKTNPIPIQIELHDDIIITTTITWKGSTVKLFAEFAATYIMCHDMFKPHLGKNRINLYIEKYTHF